MAVLPRQNKRKTLIHIFEIASMLHAEDMRFIVP